VTSITDVRSTSARLFAGMWRHLVSAIITLYYIAIIFYRRVAFCVLCVYLKFWHHPHSLGYLCANFVSFTASVAELTYAEKITYSITHPVYLMSRKPKRLHFGTRCEWHLSRNKKMT